jgi:hypothetical protein
MLAGDWRQSPVPCQHEQIVINVVISNQLETRLFTKVDTEGFHENKFWSKKLPLTGGR